jgi:hypothetical protein
MADGVDLGKGKVKIKVRPGALRVIVPEKGPALENPQEDAVEKLPEHVSSTEEKNNPEEGSILLG